MSTIPTTKQLAPYVERGLVSRVEQGPLAIYNYTERCTWDRAWDDVTRNARGLVLADSGEVAALGFPKFFNLGEPGADAPSREPDAIVEKLDGSLGILYRHEGRIRWTTRGSFYSPQAAVCERLWAERFSHVRVPEEFTPLVEIVGPETRVIVRYDDPDLRLLGIRNRFSGADLPQDVVEDWAGVWGLTPARRFSMGLAEVVDRARTMDHTEEGFVLRWGNHRVKVKSADYLRVAKLVAGMSPRFIADIWYARRSDLLIPVPEEFRAEAEAGMAALDAEMVGVEAEFLASWSVVAGETDRKAVAALAVPGSPMFPAVMQRFTGRSPDLRLLLYRRKFDALPRPVESQ